MVNGEVIFIGNYVLIKKNEWLSDLIVKVGGLLKSVYVKGVCLMCRMIVDEIW